ncbi:MAG: hypothetical protein ONB25_05180 [candidate division KSB1 bacterium]|nr:hypothetical protein [candidate division KSB1 bacterium]
MKETTNLWKTYGPVLALKLIIVIILVWSISANVMRGTNLPQ